ncbi:LOW QUALITY PROTEIN: 5'-3' DNA helicase ZGRF1 [Anolis carolinensis]|uniref:LOW QUALITY PROTEIN: 5'-3' DNA helicase ZGRF1 n=1 Tax=Anolis carolinensis TaxID=28377 RepID=UPI002F2B8C39
MACQEFTVLYTHQKTKKSKVWHDGTLKATVGGNKAILCDERGQVLDSIFVKFKVKPGDDLECDRYLITVESEKVSETGYSEQPKNTEGPKLRNNLKSFGSSTIHLPVGLKRKYVDFKGPRQLEKKAAIEETVAAVSPTTNGPRSSFPSEFYGSSPLFSVPCKKKKECHLIPSNEDDFVKNYGDTACVTFSHFVEESKVVSNKNCNTDYVNAGHLKPVLQVNDGVVKTDCSSCSEVVSQKIRSKAQILRLLNRVQKHPKDPGMETTVSPKKLPLMKAEFHPEELPPCEPFKEKTSPFLGCTSNANETTGHSHPVCSLENSVQTKSRRDAYLPSHLTKQIDETKTDGPACNKYFGDMPPVLKDSEESDNGDGFSEDQEIISQVPLSEMSISPVTESSVQNHLQNFLPHQCIMTNESDTEAVSSLDSIHYAKCVGAPKTLEEKHPNSNKDTMTDNLEAFCNESQNESSPVKNVSDGSVCGDVHGPTQQFAEVNFNLLEALDFSDTEVEEIAGNAMVLQGTTCFKEEPKIKGEVGLQTSHEKKEISDQNSHSSFLQDKEVTRISGSPSLQLCDEISEMSNRIRENNVNLHFLKEPEFSDVTIVDKKRDASSTIIQNLGHRENLDLLVENVSCKVVAEEYSDQTTQFQTTNTPLHVTATSNICFMNKSNEQCREVREHNVEPLVSCDNMKPVNSLLTISEKCNSSDSFPQYASSKHFAPEINDELDIRSVCQAITCKSLHKPQMGEIEMENAADVLDYSYKSNEGKGKDSISVKPSMNSFSIPPLGSGFQLIGSLTKHSTALETMEEMEDNTDILLQRDEPREIHKLTASKDKPNFAEVSSIDVQISPPVHSGVPKLISFSDSYVEKPTPTNENLLPDNSPFVVEGGSSKILGSKNLLEDEFHVADENVNKEFSFAEEEDTSNEFLTFNESSQPGNQMMTNSPSNLNLDFTTCPSRDLNMIFSTQWNALQSSDCHVSSSSSSKKTTEDLLEQEFQVSRIVPDLPADNTRSLFRMEESASPGSNDMLICLPSFRMRTPFVTVPIDEDFSDSEAHSSVKICEQDQQSFNLSEVNMYDKPEISGSEDRMCETSVANNSLEERQRVPTECAFPDVAEQKKESKWQKYQNTSSSNLRTQNTTEVVMTDDIRDECVLGMPLDDTGASWSDAFNNSTPDSGHPQTIKSMLCKQPRNSSSQDSITEGNKLSLHLNQKFSTKEAAKVLSRLNYSINRHIKNDHGLIFPSAETVKCADVPKRQVHIPAEFQSLAHYKQVFTTALMEHLNILLFELSQKLHKALEKADISFYTSVKEREGECFAPLCKHKIVAKLVTVKKEGRNKGRLFYACDAPKADRCDFFKWLDDVQPAQMETRPSVVLHDVKSIGTYLRCQAIPLYEECQLLIRKTFEMQRKKFGKLKKINIEKASFDDDSKTKLYLKLNRKEHSSMYSKDDIWVVSKTLNFEPFDTFIACSVFYGPSSSSELELMPLKGYSPSNWRSNMIVHALLVCNARTELTTLRNIEEYLSSATLPILQHLLAKPCKNISLSNRVVKQKFKPPTLNTNIITSGVLSPEIMINLANKMIQTFHLNNDQALALTQIAAMMTSQENDKEIGKQDALPINVIHGVFGSGKSYLVAIVILFLIEIFETREATNSKKSVPWKVLISSSTNVAVDRILLCLLDLGFDEFIRVGSVRKIAKPVLPYSLHAGSGPENEHLKELFALMKEDLTPAEKGYVRKTIELHKLGTNKALLQQVKVVGVTCAACPFPCMKNLTFPIVILDECSQMTEPASLLPVARFECEKLVLVGDPKQLPPTIQGSESAHGNGLEQTLFDRMCLMGYEPILLRTQYRCHPAISAIANDLFYEGNLLNGISEKDRSPLIDWLPTLCFYNVNGFEQMERDNSFHNMAEAFFIVKLIQSMIASGAEGSMIGVITLYKSQMSKICNLLGAVQSDASLIKAVQVSTVDAFQGAEKEIIILSCVRTKQVGFIDSEKRVNVALTRGKRHLLIVGNLNCLRKNKVWGSVIQHCTERKNGLQHVNQLEQQLNDIIKSYMERKKAEEINQLEKSKHKSCSQSVNG